MARASNLTMCSFCGKSHAEVRKLIAGPGVYICDSCINVCKGILDKELNEDARRQSTTLQVPKPVDIRRQLDQYVIGQSRANQPSRIQRRTRLFQNPEIAFLAQSVTRGAVLAQETGQGLFRCTHPRPALDHRGGRDPWRHLGGHRDAAWAEKRHHILWRERRQCLA